jgi:flagellin
VAVINTNVSALTAQNNLNITGAKLSQSIERLSSGLRINRAADDAAGMAISQALEADTRGTEQAVRNSQDGISMIQTAEGALNETHQVLQRMNELAVEASNSDLNATDRNAINAELTQLVTSIDSISSNTQFNGLSLLTGNLSISNFAGSVGSFDPTTVDVSSVDESGAAPGTGYAFSVCTNNGTATYASVSPISLARSVTQTITVRDMAPNDTQVLNFSALGITIQLSTPSFPTVTAANGVVSATDILNDLALGGAFNSDFITAPTSGAATIQIGPHNVSSGKVSLNFAEMDSTVLGIANGTWSVSTTTGAGNLIAAVQNAISMVSDQRATLGALQNSLSDTIANLNVSDENLTAANSRIRDLDVAAETVNFTKNQILQQAGTSVLAQANVLPQSVLTLLR